MGGEGKRAPKRMIAGTGHFVAKLRHFEAFAGLAQAADRA
jgi:hypothetical protein